MGRNMVGDQQDVYRVVVVRRRQSHNPEYVQGGPAHYWLYDDNDRYEEFHGPYNALATAKAQLTRLLLDYFKNPLPNAVGGRVEKAETTWNKVEL